MKHKQGIIPDAVGDPVFSEEIEKFLETQLSSAFKKRRFRGGMPEQVDRNNRIIRWHFAGLGARRIQNLMPERRLSRDVITNIINRFLDRIGEANKIRYENYREENVNQMDRDELQ